MAIPAQTARPSCGNDCWRGARIVPPAGNALAGECIRPSHWRTRCGHAVEELVLNALDANASRVCARVDPARGYAEVVDDGEGELFFS